MSNDQKEEKNSYTTSSVRLCVLNSVVLCTHYALTMTVAIFSPYGGKKIQRSVSADVMVIRVDSTKHCQIRA